MRVIILAAGMGRRLNINEKKKLPKCLLKVKDNDTILDLNLKSILSLEQLKKVIIVTGFEHELVEEHILLKYANDKIQCVFNPNFTETVIHSIKIGFSTISEENHLLLINGDTIFSKNIFGRVSNLSNNNNSSITIFGCSACEIYPDDVKLLTTKNIVKGIGKNIENFNSISSGAILFCNEGLKKYLEALNNESINDFKTHHEILEFIRCTGYEIYFSDSHTRDWLEIDTKEDFSFAYNFENTNDRIF